MECCLWWIEIYPSVLTNVERSEKGLYEVSELLLVFEMGILSSFYVCGMMLVLCENVQEVLDIRDVWCWSY